MLTPEQKQKIIKDFQVKDGDTGSAAVQIAVLTHDVRQLTEHLKSHKKDYHTQRGLMKKVGLRNRLLRYLRRVDHAAYQALIEKLELRK